MCISFLLLSGCCKGKSGRSGPEPQAEDNPPEKLTKELARPAGTEPKEGIAIAILIDASGSMDDRVMDTDNVEREKIVIAKRTAKKILEQIKKFTDENKDKTLQVGVYAFNEEEARTVVTMGELDPKAAAPLIDNLKPYGKTPIGMAMMLAKKQINASTLTEGHIIVVTDGENTYGYEPVHVAKAIKLLAADEQPGMYFVAFDIGADVFKDVIDEGVLVVEAKNAAELQGALDFILYKKILAEKPL